MGIIEKRWRLLGISRRRMGIRRFNGVVKGNRISGINRERAEGRMTQ